MITLKQLTIKLSGLQDWKGCINVGQYGSYFRNFLLNYTVCEVKYKGGLAQKPGVRGNYILYNLSQSQKNIDLIQLKLGTLAIINLCGPIYSLLPDR